MQYDYVVESFFAEYKLDVDTLTKLQHEYRLSDDPVERERITLLFKELYPECIGDIRNVSIPKTVSREMLFVQSPKGEDGLPTIHYSLDEKLLSDFRRLRGIEKRNLAVAEREGNISGIIKYNAKQLALKTLSNSLYGAGNNNTFATYNPNIAAAITFASRMCIGYLTTILGSSKLYVDEEFLKSVSTDIKPLIEIGAITISEIRDKFDILNNRHVSLRRLFDDMYNPIYTKIYEINIAPSTVIYQDTDSNYYKNEYVINHFTNNETICSPEIIDKCMHVMQHHNNFISTFTTASIGRRPIAMGFEGAYIICRYMPRKKKYYGVKWEGNLELRLSPNAYDSEGILMNDYSKYWKPKESVLPLPDGDYIFINQDKLLRPGVNYLDYINSQNVKCTGVDLARRDQYRFINLFHIIILQHDLRLMKYNGDNNWEYIVSESSIHNVIIELMDQFQQIIRDFSNIANFTSGKRPSIHFRLEDFARSAAYKPGVKNAANNIISRLQRSLPTDSTDSTSSKYIPEPGTRINFVTIIDDATLTERMKGNKAMLGIKDRALLLEEIYDIVKRKHPQEETELELEKHGYDITYDEYINAASIILLDFKYYMMKLGKAVSLYTIDTKYPELTRRINEGSISEEDSKKQIEQASNEIANGYLERYYPNRKRIIQIRRDTSVRFPSSNIKGSELLNMFGLNNDSIITQKTGNMMRNKLIEQQNIYKARSIILDEWMRSILYNSFHGRPENIPIDIYIRFKDNTELLSAEIIQCNTIIAKLESYIKLLPKLLRLQKN